MRKETQHMSREVEAIGRLKFSELHAPVFTTCLLPMYVTTFDWQILLD